MNDIADEARRAHNNPPEILPVLPPEIRAEDIKADIIAARDAATKAMAEGDSAPAVDAGKLALYSARVTAFCDACGAWADLKTITTAEQSERLTDFVAGARGLAKKVEEFRKDQKSVWDEKAKAVQKAVAPLVDKLDLVIDRMKAMQGDWLTRENTRIDAEKAEAAKIAAEKAEAARKAMAEAEARNDVSGIVDAAASAKEASKAEVAAARPAKASAGSASGGGRTMSLRTVRKAEILNVNALFLRYRNHPALIECLQGLADADVRAKELTETNAATFGVRINETQVAA